MTATTRDHRMTMNREPTFLCVFLRLWIRSGFSFSSFSLSTFALVLLTYFFLLVLLFFDLWFKCAINQMEMKYTTQQRHTQ